MTKATEPHITPPAPLPSVHELGLLHRDLYRRINMLDQLGVSTKPGSEIHSDLRAQFDQLTDEADAIDALILARPAETLADAATIAVHLYALLEAASANLVHTQQMMRTAARVTVAIAGFAGVRLDDLGSGGIRRCLLHSAGLAASVGVAQ